MSTTTKKTVSKEVIESIGGAENLRRLILKDEHKNTTMQVVACIPDRTTMGEYLKFISQNPKKAQEILVKACILTDLDEVLASDAFFNSAVTGIAEIMPIAQARVEKY
jgi:hypothetical protein